MISPTQASILGRVNFVLKTLQAGGTWKRGHARFLYEQLIGRGRNERSGATDHDHLISAAKWLERAHDAGGDGGVSGRYGLESGWTSSYPETTGYIVPTFLSLSSMPNFSHFRERAARCVEFLLKLQLREGAFPGREVAMNTTKPSPFNTAQILHGLTAWHRKFGDDQVIEAAQSAANWLLSVQDDDGAFRQHFYAGTPATYSAHLTCWLAELGQYTNETTYLQATSRHLDWILSHHDAETGWFDLCGFDASQHSERRAWTHTIAYTIWGVLMTSDILRREDGVIAASRAADGVARRLELSRWLPGTLDHRWRGKSNFACLTGNAQMALIWFRLYTLHEDPRYLSTAFKSLDLVKKAQPMANPDPGIHGGIPGSDPVWGEYLSNKIPNWSAKYFIDAMIEKQRLLSSLAERAPVHQRIPDDVPQELMEKSSTSSASPDRIRTVMYTSWDSRKIAQMVTQWSSWKFKPDLVVIERSIVLPFARRLRAKISEDGFGFLIKKLVPGKQSEEQTGFAARPLTAANFCRQHSILVLTTSDINSDETVEALKKFAPHLAIHAGADILRPEVICIPSLGTLNVHMGILPPYRGMNVAEWAKFNGDRVGCTVHLIDPGIDTGEILCIRDVDTRDVDDIAALRRAVDEAQIELLGQVVRFVLDNGKMPRGRQQKPVEGRQYFAMHPNLAALLQSELQSKRQKKRSLG